MTYNIFESSLQNSLALLLFLALLSQQHQHVQATSSTAKSTDSAEQQPATTASSAAQPQPELLKKKPPQQSTKPNIVIIMIDDMGFNDVSFHGSNQILTPNMDSLAYNGIILNRHYVPNLCTPSRATLLTGKYPIHTGTQHFVIINDEPWGLPKGERLMPELFRDAGYSTNLIGKWHLGFWRKDLTPTKRGFDHHYGYYSGYIDYYDHTLHMLNRNYSSGLDFRRDLAPCPEANGTYATEAFTNEAIRVISKHDARKPLFLVMSHLAVHTGNEDNPMQAPEEEVEKFIHIANVKRRTYAGMISSLDRSVGKTLRALSDKGILNNTIVLLYSDNGAPTVGIHSNAGSNYPFRGQKESPWEGALRSAGVIWSPLLKQKSYVSQQAIHAIDWLPTLASAAGVRLPKKLKLDGVDMWDALSQRARPEPRRLLHVMDDVFGYSAYMRGNLKYVNGSSFEGEYDGWLGELPPEEEDPLTSFYVQEVLSSEVQDLIGSSQLSIDHIVGMRSEATTRCPATTEDPTSDIYRCEPLKSACFFDIIADPCERFNLAKLYPLQVKLLEQEVAQFRLNAVPSARVARASPRSNPALHNGNWQWWSSRRELEESESSGRSRAADFSSEVWKIFFSIVSLLLLGVVI